MEVDQRYDVFVCGRPLRSNSLGRDEDKLKRSMADDLCDALNKKRIKTFMNVPGFERGDNTCIYISRALQVSRMSIVFLTKDFPASLYCLDELVLILESKNKPIYPVYYNVTSSELSQLADKHMIDYKNRFGWDSRAVQNWESALVKIMNMPSSYVGSKSTPKPSEESCNNLINRIVEWVISYMPKYHAFISFHDKDTRYSFTGYLRETLNREGFKTFMKDKGCEEDGIEQSSVSAIQNSSISIIVLSQNYAYSSSCLDELVTILDTMKIRNQLVWPIFYKVDPSDIRHQRNNYAKAMAQHENLLGKDSHKVKIWRSALFDVASLKGWHWKNEYEHDFIQKVVERMAKA